MLGTPVIFVNAAQFCLHAKGMRGKAGAYVQGALEGQTTGMSTTGHEDNCPSPGRQVAVCRGHQRADDCLHAKGIRGQTSPSPDD